MRKFVDLLGKRINRLTVIELMPKRVDSKGRKQVIWRCLCDCGRITDVHSSSLTQEKTRSCGCYRTEAISGKNEARRVSPEQRVSKIMLYRCKTGAAEKGLECTLSYNDVKTLIFDTCYYCGVPPSNTYKFDSHGPVKYSGIDRVDSEIGYTLDNVVPCCWICNSAKKDFSKGEFIAMALRVARKWGL